MNSREDPRLAYKFDLLFRGLEITSGGQRIHDYQEQLDKMHAQGLDPEDFKYYLEATSMVCLARRSGYWFGTSGYEAAGSVKCSSGKHVPRDINRLLP